jgi:cytosine/adenosine deaminase-related metal-dependent hydrolase
MGTDTFPQDLINEMRIAAVASKIYDQDTATATARQLFDAVTLTGAKALNRDDLGKIAKGAKADMVFFKANSLRMAPLRDPIKNIVYNATGEDVDKVMIDGKFVVEDGKTVHLDQDKIAGQFQKALERLWPQAEKYDRAKRSMEELSPMSIPEWKE